MKASGRSIPWYPRTVYGPRQQSSPTSPSGTSSSLPGASTRTSSRGEIGELWTRGPYTLRGYFRAPEHNARDFTPDGYYKSGDLLRRHPSGNLVVEGRIKDLINRGGEKINAEEVELLLLAHPHVVEAALVAMPDPRLGERGCAFLATDGTPVTLDDLRDHLRALDVAKYKWPERVELVDALPRTKVGKLDKKAMTAAVTAHRETEWATTASG